MNYYWFIFFVVIGLIAYYYLSISGEKKIFALACKTGVLSLVFLAEVVSLVTEPQNSEKPWALLILLFTIYTLEIIDIFIEMHADEKNRLKK